METNLSIREGQILRLVAAGMTTKEIAATLSIADSTVNWHVGNALAKLGASSRAEAVAILLREGPAEAPVVIVRTQQRQLAWPLAAVVALGVMVVIASGTSLAAWYLGSHQAPPTDRTPSVTPARSAPPSGAEASPSAPATSGAATNVTNVTNAPVAPASVPSVLPAAPETSPAPVAPITTPALPIATAPALPSVPSLTPPPSLLPLPPLPTPPLPTLPLR